MIVLFICWFGSFVFEGDGVEDVWGGRVGRGAVLGEAGGLGAGSIRGSRRVRGWG